MDDERVEGTMIDAAGKIHDSASDLAARTQAGVQGTLLKRQVPWPKTFPLLPPGSPRKLAR
jgi:hypothetical protein